jgi:perosamine synthetase
VRGGSHDPRETLPAIEGGVPVRRDLLPYGRQLIDAEDIQAVTDVLHSDWLTTGPAVAAYEQAFADCVRSSHAVAVSSGTAALHAAVFAAGVGPGDEVITTPLSFAATANCILYCGGTPVFADVESGTLNLDPGCVDAAITSKTKAIIAVDYAGHPAELDSLRAIAERRQLVLIEDAAHALGARYHGQAVGSLADFTAFSTHPVKLITTGEGGMVCTEDAAAAGRLRAFRNHGIAADAHVRAKRGEWTYEMAFLGFNYRLPDVLCALGRSQLRKLDRWLALRRGIAARYDRAFQNVPQCAPPIVRKGCESAWHLYPIRLNFEQLTVNRARIFQALRGEGVGVNVHYVPIYWHPHYQRQGYARGLCPQAEAASERLLTLPLWAGMTDQDVEDVITAVCKVLRYYSAKRSPD